MFTSRYGSRRSPRAVSTRLRALGLLVVLAAAACGGGSSPDSAAAPPPGFETLTEPSISAGEVVPAPTGNRVLTVTGQGLVTNVGEELAFDMETLERLGLVQAEIFEPYLQETLLFTGVELQQVLAAAGASPSAQLRLVALDDYQVDLTAAEVAAGGILLATREGGETIPLEEGGPARIVFLDGVESGLDGRQWIWSVDRIEIRD